MILPERYRKQHGDPGRGDPLTRLFFVRAARAKVPIDFEREREREFTHIGDGTLVLSAREHAPLHPENASNERNRVLAKR